MSRGTAKVSIKRKIYYTVSGIKTVLSYILECFIKRDKNIYLSGCNFIEINKEMFNYNTKYFFLYMSQNHPEIKFYWLCDDKEMLKEFNKRGYKNVISRNSLKGIWAILKAKYWFCDIDPKQVTLFNHASSKACLINFWHGAGRLKKVHYDNPDYKPNYFKRKFKKWYDYVVINGDIERASRKSAFRLKDSQIVVLGSPRCDVLYKDIPDSEIFMEKDFYNIKKMKEDGKFIILYTPTFRETGKDISGWLKSEKLLNLLKEYNAVLVCKLHPRDENSLDFDLPNEIYRVEPKSDAYPLLRYADMMIADFTSIYYDYLLSDKPILFYVPDLDEYLAQCREFYEPHQNQAPGAYTKNEDEMFEALEDILNGNDKYKNDRKRLRDLTYKYQDGNNCKRIYEFIKGLDK